MKQKQAKRSEGYIPSVNDIIENKRVVDMCNYYGIQIGVFSDNEIYSNDELVALKYINEGKELPSELADRLLSTREQRVKKQKNITHNSTEKDVADLFGIELKD